MIAPGTRVTLLYPAAHPLSGKTAEVTDRYHNRRGTWFVTVKLDRKVRDYPQGCELRLKEEEVAPL